MKSIKAKMLISILMVTMIIFTITIGFISRSSQNILETEIFDYTKAEAEKSVKVAQDEMIKAMSTTKTIAKVFEGMRQVGVNSREDLILILKNIIEENPDYIGLWTIWEPNALDGRDSDYINTSGSDDEGRFVSYWNRGSGKILLELSGDSYKRDDEDGKWYHDSRKTKQTLISEPKTYKLQGQEVMLVSISSPIIHEGQVVGVVGVDISLDRMQESISGIRVFESGYAQLISANGTIVGHVESALIGKNAYEVFKEDNLKEIVESGKSKIINTKSNGFESHLIVEPLETDGSSDNWILMLSVPHDEMFKELNTSIKTTVSIALIGSIILGFAVLRISRSISTPIVGLSRRIEEIANYDLGTYDNNNLRIYIDRQDEIGMITRSVTVMKRNFLSLVKEISSNAEQLTSSSEELTSNMNQSSMVSEEVAKTIEGIASAANCQAEDTEKAALNIDLLSKGIEDNSLNADELKKAADKVTDLKNLGLTTIEELLEKTSTTDASIEEIQRIILSTDESTDRIKNASTMIKNIADQTNLLALNASIEAARAGEAGKGFAVVANEIGKLAEESTAFSTEITYIIDKLAEEIEYGVRTIDQVDKIVKSQNQMVDVTNEQFQGIALAIESVEDLVEAIKNSSLDMESKKDEVIEILQNLSAIAEENAAGTEEASASVEEQVASIEEVLSASESLAVLADEMQVSISKFKY